MQVHAYRPFDKKPFGSVFLPSKAKNQQLPANPLTIFPFRAKLHSLSPIVHFGVLAAVLTRVK